MKKFSVLLSLLLVAALCFSLCACGVTANNDQNMEKPQNTQGDHTPTGNTPDVPEKTPKRM